MEATTVTHLVPILICLIGALALAVYALRFWDFSSARLFSLVAFSSATAFVAYIMQLLSPDAEQAWFWTRLRFFSQSAVLPLLVLLILDFTGNSPLQKPLLVVGFLVIPVMTQVVVWNDAWQRMFFVEWRVERIGNLLIDAIQLGGVWFNIYQVQNYLLSGSVVVLLLRHAARSSTIVRRQSLILLACSLLIFIVNLIPIMLGNRPDFVATALIFTLVLAVCGGVIIRYHFLDTFPIAYQMVFLSLKDAVIVLNHRGEVIQLNEVATALFGGNPRLLLQKSFESILAQHTYTKPLPDVPEAQFEMRLGARVFDAQLSTLPIANGAITSRVLSLRDITRLKVVEEALRHSEEMYRLLADNSSDMILLNAPDGQIVYASPSCTPQLGYTNSELLNLPIEGLRALCYHEDWQRSVDWFVHIIHGGTMPPLEFRLVRKDGSDFWVEVRATPILAAGELTHLLIVIRNVDVRRQIEAALRESNRRFNTLVENIPAVVFQLRATPDGQSAFEYISPTVRKYDALEPEDILADPNLLYARIIPGDRSVLCAKLIQSAKTLMPLIWEGRTLLNDQILWARIESVPTRLDSGSIVWNGVRLDITAQKETEIALEENLKFTDRITGMLPDVIFVFDLINIVPIYVNRSMEELVGYTPTDLTQMGSSVVALLLHEDDFVDPKMTQTLLSAYQDNEVHEMEIRIRHKSKGFIWLNLRTTVYERADDGAVTKILGVLRDVTERKAADEQRRQLLAQLEAANQNLKDFAYVVSHDLKAPLRGVSSISQWLTTNYGDKFDDDGKELIDLLGGRVRRMEQMINGVLEYSRIGREKERRLAVDLNRLVADIVQDIVPVDHIRVTVENPLPILMFEPTRIRQVFQNLIDNSVKFMDKPQGEIRIGCQKVDDMWQFRIQDNGCGIAQQHFERIFQLFQTLVPKDQFESTGVGLSLVKRIVETYNGKIWLESTPNEGTTFYFTVPA